MGDRGGVLMDRLAGLRKAKAGEKVEAEAPAAQERVRLTLRVAADVAEALALGKVRGHGTISEQVEQLVRAREIERDS